MCGIWCTELAICYSCIGGVCKAQHFAGRMYFDNFVLELLKITLAVVCLLLTGSFTTKHRRGGFCPGKGNWKWWYRPCLSCSVSYLAEGIAIVETKIAFSLCKLFGLWAYTHYVNRNLCHVLQKPALDFFGTINARPLARDLFISYSR